MEHATCLGGIEIEVDEGFWRSSKTSDTIYQCISKKSCEGGYKDDEVPVNCEEGHTGPLCSVCEFDSE